MVLIWQMILTCSINYENIYSQNNVPLRSMPCPFTGCKMFFADPNFLSQPKNLTAFRASSKTFVPAQKPILLTANHLFVWHKVFVTGTIRKQIFGPTRKIWTGTKHFATCKRTRHRSQRHIILRVYIFIVD